MSTVPSATCSSSQRWSNALVEDREPAIDLYEGLAMTIPGIVAHESVLKEGEQLAVPSFDPPDAKPLNQASEVERL